MISVFNPVVEAGRAIYHMSLIGDVKVSVAEKIDEWLLQNGCTYHQLLINGRPDFRVYVGFPPDANENLLLVFRIKYGNLVECTPIV